MKAINILKRINKVLNRTGLIIEQYPTENLRRRMMLWEYFGINKLLDIGAYIGEYAMQMRRIGFSGEIISFEPIAATYSILKQNASKDKNWTTVNIGIGNIDEEMFIYLSGNELGSSSFLEMLPSHVSADPESSYIGKEKVKVCKLDSIYNDYYKEGDTTYLKIDTQGFEKIVLEGAEESLKKIKGIQVEMSTIPLYKGEMLFGEMIELLKDKGFSLYSLENCFSDPKTGRLLQVDGIFFNDSI